jgi:D-serine deaminase-like pyridoxal phosphate-dependent protein
MRVEEIDTPALLVDLDAMESNLQQMAGFFAGRSCKLRPHFKNHKTPALARKQLEAGAIGITCATLREAEILIQSKLGSVLIANEVVDEGKLNHLAELTHRASVVVAVDSELVVGDMARIQRNHQAQFEVVVDLNIGLNRCGVPSGEAAVSLAKRAASAGLQVRGVMGYDGHLQSAPPSPERDAQVRAGCKALSDTAALIEGAGIPASIVSTGGSGTYSISGQCAGITDVQAGSYLLMDTRYMGLGAPFRRSLTVLATVVSKHNAGNAVIDCGVKALSGERGLPLIKDIPGAKVAALHAEHAPLVLDPIASPAVAVGKKIELWVEYSDATVNLHSRMYGVRNGEVEEVFQIEH